MRPLFALLCTLLLLVGCNPVGGASAVAASPPASAPSIPVDTARVRSETLIDRITAVGSLQSDESVVVTSEVSGRVIAIGFSEGERVKQGQLLFRLDDVIDQAELTQARAQLALARRTFDRSTELAARKLVSVAEVDQSRATLAVADAAVALAAARLEKTKILAPFDGVVGLRSVSLGSYVNAGDALVNLEAIDRMKIEFRIPETALAKLSIGQTLTVELDALPGERFDAEVYAINPRASEATRSIAVRARLANPAGRLRPGLFARVALDLDSRKDALVIPEAAVFPRGQQNFVYAVEDGKAALRPVTLGQRQPGQVEVLTGLALDEAIIISGLQRVSPGAAVAVSSRSSPNEG